MIGAVEREPEQLPTGEIIENLGPSARQGNAAFGRGDAHAAVRGGNPIGQIIGQVGRDGAPLGLRLDQLEAGNFDLGPVVWQIAHNGATAQIDGDDFVSTHPIGALALWVGTLAFAFDGIGHFCRSVVPGDMHLVGPAVGSQRHGVFHICASGKTRQVKREEDINEINCDDRRDAKANQAFALKELFGLKLGRVQINSGHWPCPSVKRLR